MNIVIKLSITGIIMLCSACATSAFAESVNKIGIPTVLMYGTQSSGGMLPILVDANGQMYTTGTMAISSMPPVTSGTTGANCLAWNGTTWAAMNVDGSGNLKIASQGNVTVVQSTASNLKAQVEITSPLTSGTNRLLCDDYLGFSVDNQDNVGAQTNATVVAGVAGQKIQVKSIYLYNYSTTDATITLDWSGGTVINKIYLAAKQSVGWDCPYLSPTGEGLRVSYTATANVYSTVIYSQGAY